MRRQPVSVTFLETVAFHGGREQDVGSAVVRAVEPLEIGSPDEEPAFVAESSEAVDDHAANHVSAGQPHGAVDGQQHPLSVPRFP